MKKTIYQILVVIGFALYVASLFTPILLIREFYIFEDEITILTTLSILLNAKEWMLYVIIVLFTIILPLSKYFILFLYNIYPLKQKSNKRLLLVLEGISKWAMLDVFIVAVFIASIKLKMLTSAETMPGLYLFVASIVISIICTQIQGNIQKNSTLKSLIQK